MGKEVLVIDKGGRGNAIAYAFARSPQVSKVYVTPGNAGSSILEKCQQVPLAFETVDEEIDAMKKYASENNIDLSFVGPEGYLSAGIVDVFQNQGLKIFGPSKVAAQLEGSKVFAKELMAKYKVPTAVFKVFDDPLEAVRYIDAVGAPCVVKADGLAAGKGFCTMPK